MLCVRGKAETFGLYADVCPWYILQEGVNVVLAKALFFVLFTSEERRMENVGKMLGSI
jgi:hypothetical protein